MPGGLLNLVSYGSQNVILNGNPSKTFFKCAYAKYTNFTNLKFADRENWYHILKNNGVDKIIKMVSFEA